MIFWRGARALVMVALLCLMHSGVAVASNHLRVISTDGRSVTTTVDTAFSGAVSGKATIGAQVRITAAFTPDAAHAGKRADLYTVIVDRGVYYYRDTRGLFQPWSGRIPDLRPAAESVLLAPGASLAIYDGSFATPGSKLVFVGYMLQGSDFLVYTPVPAVLEVAEPEISVSTRSYYGDHLETAVVQARCIACHVAGGLARDSALQFERSGAASTDTNFDALRALTRSKGANYILAKVNGTSVHTGGVQLPSGSTDFGHLSTLLRRLEGGGGSVSVPAGEFFNGITLQSRPETVRRAAIHLAGRLPTQAELAVAASGSEADLRGILRNMLQGAGFHRFLLEGANDRLLTDGTPGLAIDGNYNQWQTYQQMLYTHVKGLVDSGMALNDAKTENLNYGKAIDQSNRRSVGELVAYIAENDRPYTEVVTADYMMMNPLMNQAFNGGATFRNANDWNELQPAKLRDYFLPDPLHKAEFDFTLNAFRLVVGSRFREPWRHSGLLNHPVFLKRYPSTATNRNRARARWALFHFMDMDIEKSVQRPTDPAALADRNNPTLRNPACTACHELMDPVAGAFQNYGDTGLWRQWITDSLDPNYKKSGAGYVSGDLWYRDMRAPGLLGTAITTRDDSIRDLGQLIAKDPAFARATVKFWWPSVMNSDVLTAPAVQTDSDYQARLTAYQAQAAAIEQFALLFRQDYNLKNLLVEMMMSPWFRAKGSAPGDKRESYLLADVGVEKLLTPERLSRKTVALTGFDWGFKEFPFKYYPAENNLMDGFRGLYGGIDSLSVTRRQRDMTPLMSTVAQSLALESSCPIVLREFALPDAQRKLLGGIDGLMTPDRNEAAIRQKLVELHQTLWGKSFAADSAQITAVLGLFTDTWRDKVRQRAPANIMANNSCDWWNDHGFLRGIGFTGTDRRVSATGNMWIWDFTEANQFLAPAASDPQHVKKSWVVVLAYLLGHYHYLYE